MNRTLNPSEWSGPLQVQTQRYIINEQLGIPPQLRSTTVESLRRVALHLRLVYRNEGGLPLAWLSPALRDVDAVDRCSNLGVCSPSFASVSGRLIDHRNT